jgi:hypothetical protein
MHVKPPDDVLAAQAGEHEVSRLDLDQVAAIAQAIESYVEILTRGASIPEFTDELLEGRPGVRQFRDMVQDKGVGHAFAVDLT